MYVCLLEGKDNNVIAVKGLTYSAARLRWLNQWVDESHMSLSSSWHMMNGWYTADTANFNLIQEVQAILVVLVLRDIGVLSLSLVIGPYVHPQKLYSICKIRARINWSFYSFSFPSDHCRSHSDSQLFPHYYWPAHIQCRWARPVTVAVVCRRLSSSVVCNAAGGRAVRPPGAWAVGRPTLHGGSVRLRPVRAKPC